MYLIQLQDIRTGRLIGKPSKHKFLGDAVDRLDELKAIGVPPHLDLLCWTEDEGRELELKPLRLSQEDIRITQGE